MQDDSSGAGPCPARALRALALLSSPEVIAGAHETVTGAGPGLVAVRVPGRIGWFTDKYEVKRLALAPCRARLVLEGRRSTVTIDYEPRGDGMGFSVSYRGPGGGRARRHFELLASAIAERALRLAGEEEGERGAAGAGAGLLGRARRLLGAPTLELLAPVLEGMLEESLRSAVEAGGCEGWAYVSGEGGMGRFEAVLDSEGRVLEVSYSPAQGGELGGAEALAGAEGLFSVRVYCVPEGLIAA